MLSVRSEVVAAVWLVLKRWRLSHDLRMWFIKVYLPMIRNTQDCKTRAYREMGFFCFKDTVICIREALRQYVHYTLPIDYFVIGEFSLKSFIREGNLYWTRYRYSQ